MRLCATTILTIALSTLVHSKSIIVRSVDVRMDKESSAMTAINANIHVPGENLDFVCEKTEITITTMEQIVCFYSRYFHLGDLNWQNHELEFADLRRL